MTLLVLEAVRVKTSNANTESEPPLLSLIPAAIRAKNRAFGPELTGSGHTKTDRFPKSWPPIAGVTLMGLEKACSA